MVTFHTNHGDIVIKTFDDKAPETVKNFLDYCREGFYNNTIFHRVINGFMIQGGGFEPGMNQKETKEAIKNEANNGLKNTRGTLAMARTQAPHSATAQFFITGAFPGCDVPVHHQEKMGTMDPTFNPVITDNSPEFREKALKAMESERQKMQLTESYKLLEQMTNYADSPSCKEKKVCSLADAKDTFSADYEKEPGVSGPLKVGNSLVDAFTLQYYEGFPADQVAWGEIKTDQQWRVLSKLKNGYQDSLFTSTEVAQNVAKPLVKYIDKTLVTEQAKAPKITLLVGHDSNIASLLTALDFKPYQLHDQQERTPIGGKIVFQRWHDKNANQELMKIEYVYQSSEQLRNASVLSLKSPAQRVTLELKGCPVDANGFCPVDKFNAVMNNAAK